MHFFSYWYNNGCLFPDMMTVFIAVDKITKENSCLQVNKHTGDIIRNIAKTFHIQRYEKCHLPKLKIFR